jgi:hypothetical protein
MLFGKKLAGRLLTGFQADMIAVQKQYKFQFEYRQNNLEENWSYERKFFFIQSIEEDDK